MIRTAHLALVGRVVGKWIAGTALLGGLMLATSLPGFAVGFYFELGHLWTPALGILSHIVLCQKVLWQGYPVSPPPMI